MAKQWSFKNSIGVVITTGDPSTAEKYRHDPGFTEVTEGTPTESVYASQSKDDLVAEVERRNADRDPEGPTFLVVPGRGNKPDLIAALESDDATPADA